ncbi:MAG: hypothetical protein KAT16_07340 [Candidatus Heimdallarchaeota archaeon]|nr:hypothetical protein [Candidatus Heimdallarchaeota archaeon]
MAGNLPLLEFIPLLIIVLTVIIAVFALYKYLKIEKNRPDLVIGVAFLLLTLALVLTFLDSGEGTLFYDNGLGGISSYLTLIAYLIFLFAIDPMKVIDNLRSK